MKLWSISGLAQELGRDRRTVSTALRQTPADGLPGGHSGWHLRTAVAALEGGRDQNQTERLRRAQAEKVELENAQRRGELVEKAEAQEAIVFAFSRVRARFLALPAKLAPVLSAESEPRQAEATLRRGIYDVLQELSETSPERIAAEYRDADPEDHAGG